MTVNRLGSVFAIYLTDAPVTNGKDVQAADAEAYRKLAMLLRGEGILFPPDPGRAAFVSSTHGAKDVEETLAACERVFPANPSGGPTLIDGASSILRT